LQPLLPWKSKKYYIFWMCVCSLRYPARNAHTPYYHLCPVRLYNIFPHYLINDTILDKKLFNLRCVLIFSVTFVWKISHSMKNWARYDNKSVLVFIWNARYYCQSLMELRIFLSDLFCNMKFHENPSSGRRIVPHGQTDKYDEAKSCFQQFCKSA
jgi:hypothetical protein